MTSVAIGSRPARFADGVLGPVHTLSPAGQDAYEPHVAIDGGGDALIVWRGFDRTNLGCCFRVQARARSAAGVLGPVQTLSNAGQSAFEPQVAADADGDALVVWQRFDGATGTDRVQARARSAAGVLAEVQTLSAPGKSAETPRVAIDADGDALVVWLRSDDGAIQARARSAAGVLATAQTLSPAGPTALQLQVAAEADGDVVAVWGRHDETSLCSFGCIRIQARTRSAGGVLGPVQTLSDPGEHAASPQVAADVDADALAVWRFGPAEGSGCCARIHAAAGP